jgi:alkylhydroperoxidase/carboxymuconolactone decarboxylase family protein YurZ
MNDTYIAELRAFALSRITDVPDGEPMVRLDRVLIELAVTVSVTALDSLQIRSALDNALDAGASVEQLQEIVALTSGLGVHSLMASEAEILAAARKRGLVSTDEPLNETQQELWNKHVGQDPFWDGFSRELPGFLDAMLRLSPEMFEGFFAYCAIPWRSGTVSARVKELAAMACDAAPTHGFGPGFRVHLANALAIGVGRIALIETLDIAAAAPRHNGFDFSP